ncbi:hypothetical protein OROMI_000427 [Orobanche minor]
MCVAMAAPAGYGNPDEWELLHDDCFVYKRQKRPRLALIAATSPPTPDPAVERKRRRERKKAALLKLRDNYLKEISRWELMSNTLKEMERNAQAHFSEQNQELNSSRSASSGASSSSEEGLDSNSTSRRVLDDIFFKVEAQEALIRRLSNLCDVATVLCNAEDERLAQKLTDLPIWEPSPDELLAALDEQ